MNKVMLIGNLGQDPELRSTQGGQSVLTMRIATNESYVDRGGERQERTEWHTAVLFGKRADALNRFLTKGKQLYVEGRLQTRAWEDRQGQKRYSTEIVVTEVELLGSPSRGRRDESHGEQGPDQDPNNGAETDEIPF